MIFVRNNGIKVQIKVLWFYLNVMKKHDHACYVVNVMWIQCSEMSYVLMIKLNKVISLMCDNYYLFMVKYGYVYGVINMGYDQINQDIMLCTFL